MNDECMNDKFRAASNVFTFIPSAFRLAYLCDLSSTNSFTGATAHVSGLWYWARRRFTPAGLCVAGGWLVAGAVGVDIENTVTYQSFALLLAFLIFAFGVQFFLPRKIFRDAFAAAFRHRRPAAALSNPGEKSDGKNAGRPDAAGGSGRSAPAV